MVFKSNGLAALCPRRGSVAASTVSSAWPFLAGSSAGVLTAPPIALALSQAVSWDALKTKEYPADAKFP